MEQRVYHGSVSPEQLADALLDEWDRGDTLGQAFGDEGRMFVQIGQRRAGWFGDEPRQALTLAIEPVDDGLRVTMGQQQWYKDDGFQVIGGGLIGFFPFFFAFPLGGLFGGDEIDQRLPGQIWQTVDRFMAGSGAATGETRRLATVSCPSCGVANPQNAEWCSACGARLAAPACPRCGQTNPPGANFCIRCGTALSDLARERGAEPPV